MEEVFEIFDFTNATPLEKFASSLEDCLLQWLPVLSDTNRKRWWHASEFYAGQCMWSTTTTPLSSSKSSTAASATSDSSSRRSRTAADEAEVVPTWRFLRSDKIEYLQYAYALELWWRHSSFILPSAAGPIAERHSNETATEAASSSASALDALLYEPLSRVASGSALLSWQLPTATDLAVNAPPIARAFAPINCFLVLRPASDRKIAYSG
jgi:hypothetical protein